MLLSVMVLAQSVYVQGSSEGELELFYLDQMKEIYVYRVWCFPVTEYTHYGPKIDFFLL